MNLEEKIRHFCMHNLYRTNYLHKIENETVLQEILNSDIGVDIDIITIAFNNPKMIQYQVKLVKKYLKDKYLYIVADNSNNESDSKRIKDICVKDEVYYFRLPKNPYNGKCSMGSYSNGAAMNYMYHNFIKLRSTRFFGFLDHDIFPIKDSCIVTKLNKQAFWGTLRCVPTNNNYCCIYPWAGFCFFDKKRFIIDKFDFMPLKGIGDTGASNYINCFLPIIRTDEFLQYEFADLKRVGIEEACGSPQSSQYELISGSWIHYLNASNWSNEDINIKDKRMNELIDSYLK